MKNLISRKDNKKLELLNLICNANIIIANSSLHGIAIYYDRTTDPKILFKGKDQIFQEMQKLAGELNIPIAEEKKLAKDLYKDTKIHKCIKDKFRSHVVGLIYYYGGEISPKVRTTFPKQWFNNYKSTSVEVNYLSNTYDLFNEGKKQNHCIYNFSKDILSGKTQFYTLKIRDQYLTLKVSPEIFNLRINKKGHIINKFIEIKGKDNRESSQFECQIIQQWLHKELFQ